MARNLVGRAPFTKLQPWYFLSEAEMFDATDRWPSGPCEAPMLVFARRQDRDDLACFSNVTGGATEVITIHGWVADSYVVLESFPTFWEWMKSVIDDIADWSVLQAGG